MSMLKHVLAFFVFMVVSLAPVYADEGYIPFFPDFLEPIGIKYRVGIYERVTRVYLPNSTHPSKEIMSSSSSTKIKHLGYSYLPPIWFTLPETLMGPASFRGGLLDIHFPKEVKDLLPNYGPGGVNQPYVRQMDIKRKSLYNDFFNDSDRAFADANPKWALSADVTSSHIFAGYYWGVFIPAFEYHRFAKFGIGLGTFYQNLSYKLNLCSIYKINLYTRGDKSAECVGKKEIDSASIEDFGMLGVFHITIWERYTKDSIFQYLSLTATYEIKTNQRDPKLKNHDNNLRFNVDSAVYEVISYTKRF